MKRLMRLYLMAISLSVLIVGCGGGGGGSDAGGEGSDTVGGSSDAGGEGSSGEGSTSGGLIESLAGDRKASDAGFGSPFKTLVFSGLESSTHLRCDDDDYEFQPLPDDCLDKKAGYFTGRPPAPARTLEPGENEYSIETLTESMLGTGITTEQNLELVLWLSSETDGLYEGSDLLAGQGIYLEFDSDEVQNISTGEEPFHNLAAKLDSPQTPGAEAVLTININTGSGLAEVCRDEGPVEELFCAVTEEEMAALDQVSDTGHRVSVEASDNIAVLDKHVEINVLGNLRTGLKVPASKTVSGYGTTEELSDEELPISPYESYGWQVVKDHRNPRLGDWNFMYYVEGGISGGTGLDVEPGYRDVRADIPPYTVFIYIPSLDITVFGHGGSYLDEVTDRTYDETPPYLAFRWSDHPMSTDTADREDYLPKDQFHALIDQLGTVETQVYYGDLSSSDIVNGEIPEADQKYRWSEAKATEFIGAPPPPDADTGGSGSGVGIDALGGSQSDHPFRCSTPGSTTSTVPVSNGPCTQAQKNYAEVFGCNDLDNFYQSCRNLYNCAVDNSTGDFKDYYEQYLTTCEYYQQ